MVLETESEEYASIRRMPSRVVEKRSGSRRIVSAVLLGVAVNRWRWGQNWGISYLFVARLCCWTGFLYYISMAVTAVTAPIVPLLLFSLFPSEVTVWSYRLFVQWR